MTGRLGGRPFVVLWLSNLLFYLSFQLLLPVVPLYAASLGGREADVGLIIGVFAFAAMVLRPVAGRLADRVGRRPLVLAGALVFAVASSAYPVVDGIPALLALRVFHGIGMGLGPTAATVMVTDLAHVAHRGAAMGIYALANSCGLAVGPFVGIELIRRLGFPMTFVVSTGLATSAAILAWWLPETRPPSELADRTRPASLRRWFSSGAIYPSLLLLALFFSYGGLMSFLPLVVTREGLGNPGLFFTLFAVASVVVRSRAGHLADRVGRRLVVVPGLGIAGLALVLLVGAATWWVVLVAALLYGVGFGAALPALMAMTADRVPADERGLAMGTLYTAWELGISSGSILMGLAAARLGYPAMWALAAGVVGLGVVGATPHITRPRG